MHIYPMTAQLLPRIAILEHLCFSDPWSQTSLEEALRNPLYTWLVAEISGQLAGYAGMQRVLDEACVTNVAVAPYYRRRGVAKALLSALEGICRGEGCAFLTLEVRESNDGAIALYESLGFEAVGRRKYYYSRPTEDALLLTKFFTREATL